MKRSGRMARAKALAATTALACAAIIAATTAQADYNYTYTITPVSGMFGSVSGGFTISSIPTTSDIITANSSYSEFSINNVTYRSANGPGIAFFAGFVAATGAQNPTIVGAGGVSFNGQFTSGPNKINGTVNVVENYTTSVGGASILNFASGSGFFDALLVSAPSAGGGGGSGGAPAPEVNAGLGMLLAGATFVFLRRKRGGRHEGTAV